MVPTVEMAVTRAASSTPASASSVTVDVWPTFTLLMSDSLKATVIVIELLLTISANGAAEAEEEEDEEVEPPRLPAVVPLELPVAELDEDPLLDVEDPEALEVDPADTALPGERPESDTIVPLIGADSVVSASAVLALLTFAWAL